MNSKKLKIIAIVAGVVILINLVIGIVLLTRVFHKNSNFVTVKDKQIELFWNYEVIPDGENVNYAIIKGSLKNLGATDIIYVSLVFNMNHGYGNLTISLGDTNGVPKNATWDFEKTTGSVLFFIETIFLKSTTILR